MLTIITIVFLLIAVGFFISGIYSNKNKLSNTILLITSVLCVIFSIVLVASENTYKDIHKDYSGYTIYLDGNQVSVNTIDPNLYEKNYRRRNKNGLYDAQMRK